MDWTRSLGIALVPLGVAIAAMGAERAPSSRPASVAMTQFPETGGWSPDALECVRGARNIAQAALAYAWQHNQKLPPDLGQTLALVDRWSAMGKSDHRHATAREKAAMYVCPADRQAKDLPEKPTPEWVVASNSYVYLGAGASLADIPQEKLGTTILLHDKPDGRHADMGDAVIVVMLDGHAETMPRTQALEAVDASRKVFAGARAKP